MQNKQTVFSPVPVENIKEKVLNYQALMLSIINYVNGSSPVKPVIDPETQYLEFYIDKDALARIVNNIATLAGFDSLGVYFGLDAERNNKITACFLGVDIDRKILPGHFEGGRNANGLLIAEAVPGEEDWPPPPENVTGANIGSKTSENPNCLTVSTDPAIVAAFFSDLPGK